MVRVKQNGGRTIAQKPDTAEAPEMPQSAIDAGAADKVLSLRELWSIFAGRRRIGKYEKFWKRKKFV